MGIFTSFDSNESKVMLLQLRKPRRRFLSILNSKLLQKSSSDADKYTKQLKTQIRRDMKKMGWSFVPRAKLATTIQFHTDNPNIPHLPKLVKYLLDILCAEIYADDMQIEYLTACCYRPSNQVNNVQNSKDLIFIEVERLTDFKQKFLLFTKLIHKTEFRDYMKYHHHSFLFRDEDSYDIEKLWPDEETASLLNLPSETVQEWHQMIRMQNQQKLLSINKLNTCDWPEGPKEFSYQLQQNWSDLNPFIFSMEGLPTKGGKAKYKHRLRAKLRELNKEFPFFGKIIAPLELDVQISPQNGVLKKDLDNIMLDISNVFSEELLENGSYLHGYRIYIVKNQKNIPAVTSVRFKLLPFYEINNFNRLIDDVLNLGIKWLKENIWD